jgi:hypothetical protein
LLAIPDETGAEALSAASARPGIAGTLNFFRSRGVQSVIVEDVPLFPRNVGLCAARAKMFSRPYEHCFTMARSQFDEDERDAAEALRKISKQFGVSLLNTAHVFCGADACVVEHNGVILYRDKDHLNKVGSQYLGSKLIIPWPNGAPRPGGISELSTSAPKLN